MAPTNYDQCRSHLALSFKAPMDFPMSRSQYTVTAKEVCGRAESGGGGGGGGGGYLLHLFDTTLPLSMHIERQHHQ